MSKIQNHPGQRISKPLPSPPPTIWYIKPKDKHVNGCLAEFLRESDGYEVKGIDGKVWPATYEEVLFLEQSRKTKIEKTLRFSVWYKDKKTEDVKLWCSDEEYVCCNSSLTLPPIRSARYRRHQRKGLPRGSGPSARAAALLAMLPGVLTTGLVLEQQQLAAKSG